MHFTEKKLLFLIPIAAILVAFIFSLIVIPMVFSSPKEVKIAIINYDEGIQTPNGEINIGKEMVNQITKVESPIKWVEANNEKGFENKEYYAALVIPKDYSKVQASLKTDNPTSPKLQIIVDQGRDLTLANMTENVLNELTNNLNKKVQGELIGIEKISKEILIEPISVEIKYLNKIGDDLANGNAHRVLFLITWIVTLVSSVLMYVYISKTTGKTKKEINIKKLTKVLYGALASIIVGFTIAFIGNVEYSLAIPL